MIFEGYYTVPCTVSNTCMGCAFDNGDCVRPFSFPSGCANGENGLGYIWVKGLPEAGSITADIHFDTQAF